MKKRADSQKPEIRCQNLEFVIPVKPVPESLNRGTEIQFSDFAGIRIKCGMTLLLLTSYFLLPSLHSLAEEIQFHIVVKGDTLWHLSGKYMGNPFRWKEIWNLNKETVRNPNLIFPDQKIVLSEAKLSEGKIEKTEPPSPQILKEETVIAETAPVEESPVLEEKSVSQEELSEEKGIGTVLVPTPGLVVQPKSEQPTFLTNLKRQKMQEPVNSNLGKILEHADKTLFEKGDEVSLRFYKAQNFVPGELLLVTRWKESLLTKDGEMTLPSESKVLDFIGIVEITQNITPHKSMAKVIEISDFLTAGDLLQEFPQ